ncbi:ATP-binding cassette domain-containing protein [Halomonas alimentaria]|uniref:ATP-binding cassette domain-containing protein n=1 Tax=Halomonas alimentaria TaxID=147248 RepID=A0A7X4W7Y5_9GAMM|nr:ATP-binding cassette domain-containing protein [Halomonas alimentaria]
MSDAVIRVEELGKSFAGGFEALRDIDLEILRGEIFALLGPNGAGKTTLISVICGLVNPSRGRVLVDGYDNVRQFREARARIGLVPQELTNDAFIKVWDTVSFSRGLFGKPPDPAHIEKVLRSLSLCEKRNNRMITLSGGMKRRVLIAKALAQLGFTAVSLSRRRLRVLRFHASLRRTEIKTGNACIGMNLSMSLPFPMKQKPRKLVRFAGFYLALGAWRLALGAQECFT